MMKKSNYTKKALLLSMFSLMICVATLVGSTYAWFTDSVVSENNKIVTGNLEVAFTHSNASVIDETVEGATDLFTNVAGKEMKWEPGAMTYENFTVKNIGSLAVKYRFGFNITDYNTLDGKSLKDVLKIAVLDNTTISSKDDIPVDTEFTSFEEFVKEGELNLKDGTAKFSVIIKWEPTAEDNSYNITAGKSTSDGKPLFLGLGVKLDATQSVYEKDSFGSDYDEDARYSVSISNGDALLSAFQNVKDGDRIVLQNSIDSSSYLDIINVNDVLVDFNQQTANIANGNIGIRVKGTDGNHASAILSNGTLVAGDNTYCTVGASVGVLTLDHMVLQNSRRNGASVKAFTDGVINLNNVHSTSVYGGSMEAAGGTINVNGGTYVQTQFYDWTSCFGAVSGGTGTLNVRDMNATSENYGFYIFSSGGTINIHSGNFKAKIVLKADLDLESYPTAKGIINIYGGKFDGKIEVKSKVNLNIEGGTFTNTGLTLEQFSKYVDSEKFEITELADGSYSVAKEIKK